MTLASPNNTLISVTLLQLVQFSLALFRPQIINHCQIWYKLVMSDQQVVVTKRKTNRLNLDSEQEARLQAQQLQRQQQIRARKDEKRRRREAEAREIEESRRKREELQQRYEDPQTMLLEDSNSHDSFARVEKKITKLFPDFRPREHISESDESDQSSEDASESQESSTPKKKNDKKQKKEKRDRREEEEEARVIRHSKTDRVKIQEEDPKERLVKEVAYRWWYCLPEWPPLNYPYEQELNKQGYRLVESSRFRMEQNNVGGLLKASPIDGYTGIFRTKQKIIDIRPKETCPSMNHLRSKTVEQLTVLLRTALKQQIIQLDSLRYQGSEDLNQLKTLQRRLNELN